MSGSPPDEGFVWCIHCPAPHGLDAKFCPRTGKPMAARATNALKPEHIGAGTVIDKKYYVVRLIGRGGQSIVYEAMHTQLGQRVALKFLAREPDRKALHRFEQEARLAASIAHPNVCRSYDLGTLRSGTRYIVMERLEGRSLAHLLAKGTPLDPGLTVHLACQVLSALGAAHVAGVVHRDIKPANVFVQLVPGVEPMAKVLDFGLAKFVASSIRTTVGRSLGTPAYMSPEQIRGDTIDGRSDLFAIGVVLYETIGRKRPFAGASLPDLAASILHDNPVPLHELVPEIPPQLGAIVQRALAKDPAKRFSAADEFLHALRAVPGLKRPGIVPVPTPSTRESVKIPTLAEEDSSGDY